MLYTRIQGLEVLSGVSAVRRVPIAVVVDYNNKIQGLLHDLKVFRFLLEQE